MQLVVYRTKNATANTLWVQDNANEREGYSRILLILSSIHRLIAHVSHRAGEAWHEKAVVFHRQDGAVKLMHCLLESWVNG